MEYMHIIKLVRIFWKVKQLSDLLPPLTDHLIPISAEGNWDIQLLPNSDVACISGGICNIQDYYQPNPCSGYNDLEDHYFNSISENTINWNRHRYQMLIKSQNERY